MTCNNSLFRGCGLPKDEKIFYPVVLKYLKNNGYLTEGVSEKGSSFPFIRLGKRVQPDVAGIRDVGNSYSHEFEVVAVEVKDGKHCKVRYIEQALGIQPLHIFATWRCP
jgi:hypothetical protein